MKKSKGIIGGIQSFMDSAKGKTLLNYFYSWGAAIVILGTLFKLTHLPGANLMLFIGMGTEVIVFFFSAFERPYEIEDDEVENRVPSYAGNGNGQPIIINGPIMAGDAVSNESNEIADNTEAPASGPIVIGGRTAPMTGGGAVPVTGGMASPVVAGAPMTPANIGEMDKATEEYVEKVRTLTEAIERISQQTDALGHSMEELDTLSRNLTGVNALYEVHLRSAGGQLNAIDQVNEQTKKMAEQIEELNSLYARMIEAMTSKMNRPQI